MGLIDSKDKLLPDTVAYLALALDANQVYYLT
jgi:hypothetical protein